MTSFCNDEKGGHLVFFEESEVHSILAVIAVGVSQFSSMELLMERKGVGAYSLLEFLIPSY